MTTPARRPDVPPLPPGAIEQVRNLLGITDAQQHVKMRSDTKTISARELRALDLLVLGANYTQIAQALNLRSRSGAVQIVQRALAKRAAEVDQTTTSEARALYLERLERLFQRWMPHALGSVAKNIPPDPAAAKLVLDMLARFAKVTGIESPTQIEEQVSVTIENPDDQRARVLANLKTFHDQNTQVIDGTATEVDAA